MLPVEHRNSPLASVGYVWVGEPDLGRDFLRALRSLAPPLAEQVEELTYLELQTLDDAKHRQPLRRYWKGHYLRELPDEAIEALLARGQASDDGDIELLPYGGFKATAAQSPKRVRTRPRSATATRWSSSWPSRP